jgi:oligoendopeptidase F
MKFSEMPYARPDLAAVKQQFADLLARFKAAATYAEAHAVFLEEEKLNKHVDTLAQLASVRNTIDTRDKFYDEEMNFWNEATPQLQECQNAWSRAMLDSPFRADFTAEYGDLMFVNAEIADKAFSPDILDEMAQENKLTTEYGKLIASAQIPAARTPARISRAAAGAHEPFSMRPIRRFRNPFVCKCSKKAFMGGNSPPS